MADYAQMRNCSRAAVTKAVKRGQIVLVGGQVDVAAADESWPRTPPRRPSRPRTPRPPAQPDGAQTSAPGTATPATTDRSFWDRRSDTEAHRSRLLELDLQQRLGELLDRKTVEQAQVESYQLVRQRLETIADRLSSVLVGKQEPEIHQLIEGEVHATLSSLDAHFSTRTDI